jgi:hypothetical protein
MSPLATLVLLLAQEKVDVERYRPVVAADAALELDAFWEPCRSSLYALFEETPVLRDPHASVPRQRHAAADFRPFLPEEPVALGEVWRVDDAAALAFLRQLHPGVVAHKEFSFGEVPGTWATLRAVGPEAFEILLRAHAVFELEGGVVYKPAQFEGRLVLGRADGTVRSFTLALPSRDTNVDVNVPTQRSAGEKWVDAEGHEVAFAPMAADIGWVPRMEITSREVAPPAWTHEVSDETARLALRRAFYPSAALDWLPFEEAVLAARERKKPLHLVLLFGCLDDDSC